MDWNTEAIAEQLGITTQRVNQLIEPLRIHWWKEYGETFGREVQADTEIIKKNGEPRKKLVWLYSDDEVEAIAEHQKTLVEKRYVRPKTNKKSSRGNARKKYTAPTKSANCDG